MRRFLLAASVAVLGACGDLRHENPYDPRAAPDTQAKTSFAGTVSVEAVGGVAPSLAGIPVSLAGQSYSAVTDAAGHYVISGVPAGTYTIQAVLADYDTAAITGVTATLDTGGRTVPVPALPLRRVRAPLRGTVSLRLPNDTLETSGGASVSLSAGLTGVTMAAASAPLSAAPVTGAALTTASGDFVIGDVPAPLGSYTLTASKLGYVTQTSTVTFQDGAFVVQTVQLQIDPGAIVGTAAVRGAADSFGVTVRARGATLGGTPWEATTTSAADGAFRISGLPAGTYGITFERADLVTAAVAGRAVLPGADTALGTVDVLPATGAAQGVVTATGAASHAGTVVEIAGGPDRATAVTDATGAWRVTGLRVGTTYTATYLRPGYTTPASTGFAVTVGGTTDVPASALLVSRTATLSGVATVARPAGAAASAGILVSLSGADLNGAGVTGSTTTAAGGAFTLAGVPQGTYALSFTKAAYETQTRSGIAVMDGGAAVAPSVILAVSTGTISGQVVLSKGAASTFSQGTDYSGAVVTLSGLEGGAEVPVAITDVAGSFRFDGVPVHTGGGVYTVQAQRSSYTSAAGTVTALANATAVVAPTPLTLPVAVGSVGGTVAVNETGAAATPADGTVMLALTGTAFNSTAFAASATNVGGAFTVPIVPPGTYQVSATSTSRACTAPAAITVPAGGAVSIAAGFLCTDAVPPGSVALGVPAGPGADPGYTSLTSVSLPVVVDTNVDPTFNVSGYQHVAGAVPAWSGAPITAGLVSPIAFPAGTLAADGTATLWVRAVDRVGNAGPAASVQIIRDTVRPGAVAIETPRTVVNATSTTAIITGGADANFKTYQACTSFADPTATCGGCTPMIDTAPSIAVTFDAPNRKACIHAQALDRAGNVSATPTLLEVTSDLTAPTGPDISPLYDPATVTVHADAVDFQIVGAAKDAPGLGDDWRDIAWVEADTGSGFTAICPQEACRVAGSYTPCTCGCQDDRLVCDGARFAAIRLPLNSGTANRIAVRAVDVAGNVGSGASQQVMTSGVLTAVATTTSGEKAPRVRGRTLAYNRDGTAVLTDLGSDVRWQPTDPSCDVPGVRNYELAVAPLDSDTVFYTTGSSVRVRRRGTDWCTGYTDVAIASASPGYVIYAVDATFVPSTARVERIAWAENDTTNRATRVWTSDAPSGPGQSGRFVGAASPVSVYQRALAYTTRVYTGGDVLLVRVNTTSTLLQFIDGAFTVYHRPAGGWGTATPVTYALPAGGCTGAAIDSTGTRLAWVTSGTLHTLHLARPGADGVYGSGDDVVPAPHAYAAASGYEDVAVEGGHAVVTDYSPNPTGHLVHWAAGPDGTFGTSDDSFASMFPTASARELPSLGDGLGGGVVYFAQSQGANFDVFEGDLSAFRWDTHSDFYAVYPRSNRAGTYFFGRSDGVWARAPDGRETTRSVSSTFYGADGNVFAAQLRPPGHDVVVHLADASGQFFTPAAPPGVVVLTGKAGASYVGSRTDTAAGGGRVIVSSCEAWSGSTCTEDGVELIEPSPTLTTAVAFRIDRPADGAPATSTVSGSGVGVSARHAAYTCSSTAPAAYAAICIREPGTDGKYEPSSAPGHDDRTFLLNRPGTTTPYSGTGNVKLDGDRVAFYYGTDVVAVDAGVDAQFNTSDDVETILGPYAQQGASFIALAGDFVAWMTTDPALGNAGGPFPFVADVRNRTRRRVADHYSAKYGITVDRSGRVAWEDEVFSTSSVFVCAP